MLWSNFVFQAVKSATTQTAGDTKTVSSSPNQVSVLYHSVFLRHLLQNKLERLPQNFLPAGTVLARKAIMVSILGPMLKTFYNRNLLMFIIS